MRWLRQITTALPSFFKKKRPRRNIEEDDIDLPMVNARTRYVITIISFLFLSVVFALSFYAAFIAVDDVARAQIFLEFAKDISYVLGVIVTSYIGAESVFPSHGRRYGGWGNRWRNDDGYGGGFLKDKIDIKKEEESQTDPPHGDEQVD